MTTPPPLPPPLETHGKLRRELSIFFVGLGLLIGVAAYFAFTGLVGNPHPLWGFPRHSAIGLPLGVLSMFQVTSGVLLAIFGSRFFCGLGAIASIFTALFYLAFMFSATGKIPMNLITGVVVLIPILVWTRARKFLAVADLPTPR